MAEPDDFRKGPISAGELNELKRAAFEDVAVDGGATHQGAFGKTMYPERPPLRIKARVFAPTVSGSEVGGSEEAGSGTETQRLCPGQRVYAFQEQQRVKCGQFEDNDVGYRGDGDLISAFEQNNMLVKDDTIQTLELHMVWTDDDGEQIEEWIFEAANGTTMPDQGGVGGSGEGGSLDTGCNGIPVNYCDPITGDSIQGCLVGQVALLDSSGNELYSGMGG